MRKNWKKSLFKISRTLHVYCSTMLCVLLIFFSFTGITLNHQFNMDSKSNNQLEEFTVSERELGSWINTANPEWNTDLNALQRYLSDTHSLPQAHSIEIDQDIGEINLEYKVPAGYASVYLDITSRALTIETEPGSAVGVLNDLHKGRYSGEVWSWLIDLSAGVIILFSLTGLVIVYQGKKYKSTGTISIALGVLLPSAIYFFFVPSL